MLFFFFFFFSSSPIVGYMWAQLSLKALDAESNLTKLRLLTPPCLACVVNCGGFGLVGWLAGGAGWFVARWRASWIAKAEIDSQ